MKKYFLAILVLALMNCAKTDYYLKNVDAKVRMTGFTSEEGYVLKRRFELSHTRVNIFWGLANVYKKDLELILLPEFRNYETEAVGNLTITEKYDFLDSLVDWVLVGLIRPHTVILEGNLYEKGKANASKETSIEKDQELEKDNKMENKKTKEATNVKKK